MIKASNILVYVVFALLIGVTICNRFIWPRHFEFGTPITNAQVRLKDSELSTATHIFDSRLAQYQAIASDIKTMLYSMVIVTGISIYTTITRPRRFKLPFLDLEADAVWLRWACPAILVYLWLHFGFALYSSMISRVFLLDLRWTIENSVNSIVAQQEPLKYAIEDRGIGDFIFYLFSPAFASNHDPVNVAFSWIILVGTYGMLLGVVHGTIMAGIISWMRVTTAKVVALFYLVFVSVLIVGSHLAFNYRIPNLWVFALAICVTGIATFFLLPTDSESTSKGPPDERTAA